MCKIYSKETKSPEQRHSGVFVVNSEHILHIALVFPYAYKCINISRASVTRFFKNEFLVENQCKAAPANDSQKQHSENFLQFLTGKK